MGTIDREGILSRLQAALAAVKTRNEYEAVKAAFVGKQGEVTSLTKALGGMSAEERPAFGQTVNEVKKAAMERLEEAEARLRTSEREVLRQAARVDVSLPGRRVTLGDRHPITLVRRDIEKFFTGRGFLLVEGPEVESEWYNFEALNIPADHPARDSQDSFYLAPGHLMRTQTSPVQIRVMEKTRPPLAILSPGRVYRRDTLDATHSFEFHQVEGLLVDKGVTFADLKGLLTSFLREMFGSDAPVRFRPDFFPFTEPSCDISVGFGKLPDGSTRFLEVLGAGLVHPQVLKNVKIDPEEYGGIAFGLGIERIAMIRYGIPDIRLFWQNDTRFLSQFR